MTRVAEVNRLYYESSGVAEQYRCLTNLCPAEKLILDSFKEEIKDRPLLEIGVGGGRITPYLTALTEDYIGIDCSRTMLDVAREKFPTTTFFVCAAEKMTMFEKQRFATVVFWGNGIDEVEHKERIAIFREINRVLKKGGIFLLSSQNFDWGRLLKSAAFYEFSLKRGPLHIIGSLPRRLWIYSACKMIRFFARLRNRGYAIFPQYGEKPNITTSAYYIRSEAQIQQLMSAGFEQVQTFTSNGVVLNDPAVHVDYGGRSDFELYYVSRKSCKAVRTKE